ncbi:5'/3'-nucleotidase SurE [Geochorda subterranea]|uniref:5'-nucleotidase SurE n=1 Tax=Geochorda subterranea TaxID=3109564 RepID=A0ABZ1BKL4_9FIRM|nr:5'/3'-nucleotidase SurE [Limnochorda sp. LNt]WRP13259.1 5'/3'-nucleotidase SurE [Limnochorda sp. LNt]
MRRILLSNDDGIHAPGLQALAESLAELGEIVIVAPDRDRSGTGHAITVREDLHVERLQLAGRWQAYAVSGTPADCVKLGVLELCDSPPDLVVSGINAGANLGIDVFYSGTVAAAFEGTLLGIPALAISCITRKESPDFRLARAVAPLLADWLMGKDFGSPLLLNVNVPERARATGSEVLRWTRLGLRRRYRDDFAPGTEEPGWPQGDGREAGRRFRLVGDADDGDSDDPTTDAGAVEAGWVSVTPIHLDMTDYGWLGRLGVAPGEPVTGLAGLRVDGRPAS